MIRFHFHPSPNPLKVALALEEMGLTYEVVPVDTFRGEQHSENFRTMNPNGKVRVIEDAGMVVFDSNAILVHLAERTGRYLPAGGQERAATVSWLFFVATGLSPFSGQAVHFLHMAPERIEYARNRYLREVERHYGVIDARLARCEWLAGDDYTIADMAAWGWLNYAGHFFGKEGLARFPGVNRLFETISARPSAAKAHAMKDAHTFASEFDEAARRALFPQNYAA